MRKHIVWIAIVSALGCGGGGKGAEAKADTGPAAAPTSASTVAPEIAEAPVDPRTKQLDSASARLAAGRKAFDGGDFPRAMLEAQRGLDALGKDYAGPGVEDDTDLKIAAAKERADLGSPSDGATVMLRMLAERIELARRTWQIMP